MTGKVFFGSAESKLASLQENGLAMEDMKIKFRSVTYCCHHLLAARECLLILTNDNITSTF